MMNPSTSESRKVYLDWLRVLAILAIFVFHNTRFFDPDDWAIKNPTTYHFVEVWKEFATSWGMPLILIVSGASAFFALGKFSPGKYVKGLLVRLLLPLVVGMLTHLAWQVYLERVSQGLFKGSFFEFYPHYFEGLYALGGNFAWMGLHLWYLEALFIFSLLLLPLFWWLRKRASGQRVLKVVGDLLAAPGAALLFALPVILLIYSLDENTWGMREFGGWSIFIYPCFLIAGFVIVSHSGLQASLQRMRWFYLGSALLLSPAYLFLEYQKRFPDLNSLSLTLGDLLLSLSAWCWLLAIFGFAVRHLNRGTPFIRYANEAALSFYILHQTVIVSLGFFVVRWAIPDGLKFALLLATSFLVTLGLYEFLVRRFNLLRFLFGMKLRPRPAGALTLEAHGGGAARAG